MSRRSYLRTSWQERRDTALVLLLALVGVMAAAAGALAVIVLMGVVRNA